jgi:hypothetical protein
MIYIRVNWTNHIDFAQEDGMACPRGDFGGTKYCINPRDKFKGFVWTI